MIAYRPTNVFENMGPLEQDLYESAGPMLASFEAICHAIQTCPTRCFRDVPSELTKEFPALLFDYLKRFKAWKVPDEEKLTRRIRHALIALYQAENQLPPDEPEDSRLKVEFCTQIERLRGKLVQIAGADALRRFDDERLQGRAGDAAAKSRPQAAAAASSGGGSQSVLPGRMSNEQLAHELLLDPGFQLDGVGDNPVLARIRESFHRAFWDSLVDDLRLATPCYARVIRVLGEIRDGLCEVVGPEEARHVGELVDLEFIRGQVDQGLYSWESCSRLIASLVKVVQRTQSVRREEETAGKWREAEAAMAAAGSVEERARALCGGLELVLERLNAMRIDAANARLRFISPIIMSHGIEYERRKFDDKVKDGSISVESTRAWIASTASDDCDLARIHINALLSLVTAPSQANELPATLGFEFARINCKLRPAYAGIVLACIEHITRAFYHDGSCLDALLSSNAAQTSSVYHVVSARVQHVIGHRLGAVATPPPQRPALPVPPPPFFFSPPPPTSLDSCMGGLRVCCPALVSWNCGLPGLPFQVPPPHSSPTSPPMSRRAPQPLLSFEVE
mmetsp:Transcript_4190/g.11969  ORF Transcript_4190/g.11969 Transcript_4190/m.11969 type:complete len:567 (-) Transcript_4190:25-1725(-)